MRATPRLKWTLIEECLDEAEYLWGKRERALDAHEENLDRIWKWTEQRLLAAMDGLTLAGDDSIAPLLQPALGEGNKERAAVATYILASLATPASIATLAQALETTPARPGLRAGLELAGSDLLLERLAGSAGRLSPLGLALLTDVRAFHGSDVGNRLHLLMANDDDDVKAAAVRVARGSTPDVAGEVALWGMNMEQPEICTEAMELGFIVGLPSALAVARQIIAGQQPGCSRAAVVLATAGRPAELQALIAALVNEEIRRDVLFALGFAGTAIAAEACLASMRSGRLPRVAAESFCCITGLDLAREQLVVPDPPEPTEPVPFEDDDMDADLVTTSDENLPMPDVAGVDLWWTQHRRQLTDGERFVYGRPLSLATLHERLSNGPCRRRQGWALEVAACTRGACRISTRALASTQQAQLKLLAEQLASAGRHANPSLRGPLRNHARS